MPVAVDYDPFAVASLPPEPTGGGVPVDHDPFEAAADSAPHAGLHDFMDALDSARTAGVKGFSDVAGFPGFAGELAGRGLDLAASKIMGKETKVPRLPIYFPTPEDIRGAVFRKIPEYKPKSDSEDFAQSALEGATSVAASGGLEAIPMLTGAASQMLANAGRRLFPDHPAASFLMSLAAPAGVAGARRLFPSVPATVKSGLREVGPAAADDAADVQAAGNQIGVPVTGPEAINNPALLRLQQLVEQSDRGQKVRDIVAARPDAQRAAVLGQTQALGDLDPAAAGPKFSGAAGAITDRATDEITRRLAAASQPLEGELTAFEKGATGRVIDAARTNLDSSDYYRSIDSLSEAQQKAAGPLFQEAFKANTSLASPLIDRILRTPSGQQALDYARSRMQNKMSLLATPDKDLSDQLNDLAALGQQDAVPGGVASGLKLKTLDLIRQGFGDQERALVKQVATGNARAGELADIGDLRRAFTAELKKQDATAQAGPNSLKAEGGAYERALNSYAGPAQLKGAIEDGKEWAAGDVGGTQRLIADLTDSERQAYRTGVVQDVITQAQKSPDAVIKKLGQDFYQQKLGAIFPDQQKLGAFYDAITDRSIPDIAEGKLAQLQSAAKTAITKIQGTTMGRLAAEPTVGGQANIILDPKNMRPDQVTKTLRAIGKQDPEATPNFLRNYVENVLDQSTKRLAQGPTDNVGGRFYSAIAGTPNAQANLRAAFNTLPGGTDRWNAFANTLKVFEANARRLPVGSPTVDKKLLVDSLTPGSIARPLNSAADWWGKLRYGRNMGKLAELFARSDSVDEMRRIAGLSATDPKSLAAVRVFVNSAPEPRDKSK